MFRKPAALPPIMICMLILSGCAQNRYRLYGQQLNISPSKELDVAKLLADPEPYDGKTVRLTGRIDDVCAHRGCWVTMSEAEKTLRVKFTCPIEGRFVPMEAKGHQAVVEGKFEYRQIPEAEARHYLEDQGASPEEIAKIQGPQQEFFMRSEGILIEGGENLPAQAT